MVSTFQSHSPIPGQLQFIIVPGYQLPLHLTPMQIRAQAATTASGVPRSPSTHRSRSQPGSHQSPGISPSVIRRMRAPQRLTSSINLSCLGRSKMTTVRSLRSLFFFLAILSRLSRTGALISMTPFALGPTQACSCKPGAGIEHRAGRSDPNR